MCASTTPKLGKYALAARLCNKGSGSVIAGTTGTSMRMAPGSLGASACQPGPDQRIALGQQEAVARILGASFKGLREDLMSGL
jgi:hypothetical protein